MNAVPQWTPKRGSSGRGKRLSSQELVLAGAYFERSYLENTEAPTWDVFFEGDLGAALTDLRQAVREAKKIAGFQLPIQRLRASMLARLPNLIALDTDLGLPRRDSREHRAVASLYRLNDDAGLLPKTIAEGVKRWYHDVLNPWASAQEVTPVAERVFKAALASNIVVTPRMRSLLRRQGDRVQGDLPFIARHAAESLIGEELFSGLPPCELVIDALYRDPAREAEVALMSAPYRLPGRDESFSMVATLTAITLPYSDAVYLKTSATKRVWAKTAPDRKRNVPFRVRAYLLSPDRPAYTVSLEKGREGWQFGPDYAEWRAADPRLPASVAEAIKEQLPDGSTAWVGVPELTTLYDAVSPRTVFEGDELALHATVVSRLKGIVVGEIPFRAVPFRGRRSSADVTMLKLKDVSDLGLAGQSLEEEEEPEEEEATSTSEDEAEDREAQREKLRLQRERNCKVLERIHGSVKPTLWLFHEMPLEREIVEKSIEQLFGNAVVLRAEQLPQGTHGLKTMLPGADSNTTERFNRRVAAWMKAAELVASSSPKGSRYVLICASDREQGRTEDQVNYYAGIHAMCRIADANVHHVLPVGGGDQMKAQQNFVHRLQSALLDVFFAHSGIVFGTEGFLTPLFSGNPPKYIYGVQALRSNARSFSGELNVSFLVFTRLSVESGKTQVLFVYRKRHKTEVTPWREFSEGLRWLGSQRELQSDEMWLKQSTAEQVRRRLGQIADEDPRALVLVDWSSMRSLWHGISDEALTSGSGVPTIDGYNIASICPGMTLVRLRRDGRALSLRTRNTYFFERLREGTGFTGQTTGESYSESYATTTKRIVAVTMRKSESEAPLAAHYIQSMNYRKTAQLVRGQSCYRTTERMQKRKDSKSVFELRLLDPSQQDAALPAPLEVTVMSAPKDVNPDQVAIAVLGMRLGYVHYGEWTSLPAPLFFKRKIEDYIIRYRSPASALSDEPLEAEPEAPELAAPDLGAASIPDPTATRVDSEYVRKAADTVAFQAGVAEPNAASEAPRGVSPVQDLEDTQEVLLKLSEKELQVAEDIPDETLLELVKRAARSDITLCGYEARARLHLYRSVLRGIVHVNVALPSFVTPAAFWGPNATPTDRRALKRFWRDQQDFEFLRHGEPMPALTRLPEWLCRRLQIPQGGYSLHCTPRLFPSSIFYAVRQGWRRYMEDQREKASEGADELSESSIELDRLTQWAVAQSDDELTAWLVFGSAQFPTRDVLRSVIENLKLTVGPKTREALHYFLTSARAAVRVIAIKPGSGPVMINLAPSYRAPRAEVRMTEEGAIEEDLQPMQVAEEALTQSPSSSSVSQAERPISTDLTSNTELLAGTTVNELAVLLTPGQQNFQSALETMRRELDRLETEHVRIIRSRAEESERLAAQVRAKAALEVEWTRQEEAAGALLAQMRRELPDTGPWTIEVHVDRTRAPEEVGRHIEEVTGAVAGALNAQREYQTVVERAAPPGHLTPVARGRHQREWQEAVSTALHSFESALNTLADRLRAASIVYDFGEAHTESAIDETRAIERTRKEQMRDNEPPVAQPPTAPMAPASPVTEPPQTMSPARHRQALPATATEHSQEVPPPTAEVVEHQAEVLDEDEEEPAEGEALEGELQRLESRANTLGQLIDERTLAIADLYAEVCDLDERSSALHDDHGLLCRAALESIQSLRAEIPLERKQAQALSERLDENGVKATACETLTVSLALLAAGLHEMLFPPHSGSARWRFIEKLRPRLSGIAPLSRLLQKIEDLEGFNLVREMLAMASIGESSDVHRALSRMRERAKRWPQDPSLYTNWTKWDYRRLHERIFTNPSSPIAQCLNFIAAREDLKAESVFHEARKLLEKPTKTIDDLAMHFDRRRSFHGAGRDHVRQNMEQTLAFIKEYFETAQRAKGFVASVSGNFRNALDALYSETVASLEWIDELTVAPGREGVYRKLAILALSTLKHLFHGEPLESALGGDFTLMLRVAHGRDLRPSIYALSDAADNVVPPVVDPVEVIAEIETLTHEMKAAGPACYSPEWVRAQLDKAAQDHDSNGRLLPVKAIDRRLSRIINRSPEQLKRAGLLSGELQRERQKVTHAMALGALTQTEASRILRIIAELLEHAKSSALSDLESAPVTYPDFPHAYAALRRLVSMPLEEKLERNRKDFLLELDQYESQSPNAPVQRSEIDRIRKSSEGSVSNLRAARDMFSLLKENALPPKRQAAAAKSVADEYKQFLAKLKADFHSHQIQIKTVITRLRAPTNPDDPEYIRAFSETDRAEAATFLQTWVRLCEARAVEDAEQRLKEFFRALASIEPSVLMERHAYRSGRLDFSLEKPFAGLDRHAIMVFIPPSLGSRAPYLHGIVFGNKPTDAMIAQAIEERGSGAHTFILCHGRLTLEQRATLSRHHRVILIDDDLVMFAALHPDARLGALLRVALLTYHDNPYDDYGTSPVPPEMFFGRLEQRESLANVKAAAVLFGGRRLGKSSLLDQLRRDARRGAEAVLYIPLDRGAHDMSEEYESIGWNAIRSAMVHAGLLAPPKKEPTTARDTKRLIESEIMAGQVKARRIYLLIDEADELMGHDLARKGTPFISSLVNLTEVVREKCALRFVIAGLHNLTRMASDENSALGKFDAIALKPFWSAEDIKRGTDLIRLPLEALGYYFAVGKEDMPLRIMAVCNFYPAFIQLYCKRLVSHLQNRRDRKEPPTYIDESDLDAVEYDRDFLKDIRGKFKLNLALDTRYAAIALILADQYYREGAKSLTANELRALCELWAPRHFATTGRGGYEALLEEMEILTILERGPGGRYGLRTPNIAMMIGDRESVEQRLDSLQQETPVQARSRGEIRIEIALAKRETRERPLFPMPAAWVRSIFSSRFDGGKAEENPDGGLIILSGNDRSGLTALGRLKGEAQLADTAVVDVGYYPSPHAARAALVRGGRSPAVRAIRGRRLQCIAPGAWKVSDVTEYARLARTLAQRPRGTSLNVPVTRLALLATPEHSFELAQRLAASVAEGWQVIPVAPWSDDALYYYLESTEKPELGYSNAARETLLEASCGFGSEVERLCETRQTADEAMEAIADAERQLAPNLETFYRQIGMPRTLSAAALKQIENLMRALDGEQMRHAAETLEYCSMCDVSEATLMFVRWMGLLQEGPGGTWHVPTLYRRLLG